MSGLPVMLNLAGRRAVVVGGGPTAARRAASLAEAGAEVVVIAPEVAPAVEATAATVRRRAYRKGDLDGAAFVVICTDDAGVNARVAAHAAAIGAIVNRADDPDAGDAVVLAHRRTGPLTVGVSTDGISAAAAARIADAMIERLDRDWVRLLMTVAPFRELAQQKVSDPAQRRGVLTRLTDERAMATLKDQGDEALADLCRALIADASADTDA